MTTIMKRALTIKYWPASERLEKPKAKGWFAYCPELDLEVRGKDLIDVTQKIHTRIDREAERAQRDINRVIDKYKRQGWAVTEQPFHFH
jgi:hypothetical protein